MDPTTIAHQSRSRVERQGRCLAAGGTRLGRPLGRRGTQCWGRRAYSRASWS